MAFAFARTVEAPTIRFAVVRPAPRQALSG